MHPLGLIFGLLAIGTVLLDAFETIILPRRASGKIRLTRLFYVLTWRPWAAVVGRFRNRRREPAHAVTDTALLPLDDESPARQP